MSITIYMPMLGEGTDVWRPVQAQELGSGLYRVIDEPPEDEQWLFGRNAIVVVDAKQRVVAQSSDDS